MLWIKLLRSLIKALNSEGTPGQVAAGMALGAVLGLTPLMNLHNLVIFSLIVILNVSFPGAMLGWAVFTPVGFLLDPVFDAVGRYLLVDTAGLHGFWTAMMNTPVVALANLNNTVVLGSFVVWLAAAVPLYFAARYGIARYRATVYERLKQSRLVRGIMASKIYDIYNTLRPS